MRLPIFLALGAILLGATPAHACLCVMSGGVKEAARRADAVFAGRVTATRIASVPFYGRQLEATIVVERRWKGGPDTVVVVRTMPPGGPCAFPFQAGNTYLVFAMREIASAPLETSICSRTARLSHALADVAALGPGVPMGMAWDQPRTLPATSRPRQAPRDSRITAPDDD